MAELKWRFDEVCINYFVSILLKAERLFRALLESSACRSTAAPSAASCSRAGAGPGGRARPAAAGPLEGPRSLDLGINIVVGCTDVHPYGQNGCSRMY